MLEVVKAIMVSNLSDSDKVEYINAMLEADDKTIAEFFEPENVEMLAAAVCPPHIWNKSVIPWKCFTCGLKPSQIG